MGGRVVWHQLSSPAFFMVFSRTFQGRGFWSDRFKSNGIRRKFNIAMLFRSLKFAPSEKYYIFTAPVPELAIDFRQPAESPGGK
jgi:hypothetical protein